MISNNKNLRVGGDFELTAHTILQHNSSSNYISFNAPSSIQLNTGRSALYLAAKMIQSMESSGRVWLPAYGCESISNTFASAGFDICYYSVGGHLLQEVLPIETVKAGDTVLFIHYFGHLNKQMLSVVPAYREKGVWTIEDFVQASLIKNPTLTGDFAVTSYRKLLSVPDGAVLASRFPVDRFNDLPDIAQADESFISSKIVAKMLRANNEDAETFLPIMERAEHSLSGDIIPRHISWFSNWIVSQVDLQEVADKRRENWRLMYAALKNAKLENLVRPLFLVLDEVEVPLGFPVVVTEGKRDSLRRFLVDQNIFCPIHWDMCFLPSKERFPAEVEMSKNLLTLPIDQRVTKEHIDYMMDSINSFFRKST